MFPVGNSQVKGVCAVSVRFQPGQTSLGTRGSQKPLVHSLFEDYIQYITAFSILQDFFRIFAFSFPVFSNELTDSEKKGIIKVEIQTRKEFFYEKIIAAILVIAVLLCALTACGKTLSGTYSAEVGGSIAGTKTSYTFSGKKVTITMSASLLGGTSTTEFEGTYEIKEAADGTQSITFTFEDANASTYSGTQSFSTGKTEDGVKRITIGLVTYTATK